ncbi:MAG: hypothetical protein ABIZ57_06070 [Candidatus Limnocylindria bacterium]
MRNLGAWLVFAFVIPACMPVVAPIVDDVPEGPQLAIQVTNGADQEVAIGYSFEAFQSSGGGEGSVGACEQATIPFGSVGGTFTILVDGESLFEHAVAAGTPADAWMVVRVTIGSDGDAEVTGTNLAARMPDPVTRPIPNCG